MAGYCLMTNDVESLSINGQSFDEIGMKVWKEALPALLALYEKYNVKATFFFVAEFAKQYPEVVKMIQPYGHEVACHGLNHEQSNAFDVMPLEKQIQHLGEAKKILEDLAGESVVSFRAPALRVNQDTPIALKETGFKIDSSIAPQRMDIFMSLGSKNKMQWLKAPRTCYETAQNNLARRGNSGLIEVPVSSFGMPYIGTLMRISSFMNNMVRYFIYLETKNKTKAVNFLFHPSEMVEENEEQMATRKRTKNPILHLFSDVLRTKLKQRNLGEKAGILLEKELFFWQKHQFGFQTMKDFVNQNI
ncbi:polysaccharide deacetylase family protein [Bacteroidales bacterium OttesenSCG-928-I21]|nr:polysaccharide deacetylase family protein [Bacteroidales bacterium OttesenSCG-928-I21]